MRKIILASASPRRKELLKELGFDFEVDPSDCKERVDAGLKPYEAAEEISSQKAEAVMAKYKDAIIIGADTIIVLEDKIIGKPKDKEDAKIILSSLGGKEHSVITGFTIIDSASNKFLKDSVETKVYFKELLEKDIEDYVRSGEPMDKAGAYGIQGRGGELIKKIKGDYSNVVGLPLQALKEDLKEFGI